MQGIVSLLSHVAESNFQAVLATLTTFASRLCKGRNARISRRKKVKRYGFPSWHSSALFSALEPRCIAGHWGPLSECLKAFLPTQMELDSTRAQATRSALVLAHGSLALRASKEQLLAHLEGDIVGNILMLYSCSCRVRAQSVPGCLSAQLQPLHMGDAERGLPFPKVPRGMVFAQMKTQALPLALPPRVPLAALVPSRSSKNVLLSWVSGPAEQPRTGAEHHRLQLCLPSSRG